MEFDDCIGRCILHAALYTERHGKVKIELVGAELKHVEAILSGLSCMV